MISNWPTAGSISTSAASSENSAASSSQTNSHFLISLCGSSCHSVTSEDEVNVVVIKGFRVTYDDSRIGAVLDAATCAMSIFGFGMIGGVMGKRQIATASFA